MQSSRCWSTSGRPGAGKVKVGKVNVDDERELALQFGVNSIPTVMVFQNGEIKATSVGYRPKEEIEQLLK